MAKLKKAPPAPNTKSATRAWATVLPREVIVNLEAASHRYTYKGLPLIKNPFDFAIYPLLFWNLKPKTIVEVGSYRGASALWMADLLQNLQMPDFRIYSIDLWDGVGASVQHPNITFLHGDGQKLDEVLPAKVMSGVAHPLLIIDDADHAADTTLCILRFADHWLEVGDYVVAEDGATANGPAQAITQFLQERGSDYTIDGSYCDFFGYNATWCINGYLRRTDRPRAGAIVSV